MSPRSRRGYRAGLLLLPSAAGNLNMSRVSKEEKKQLNNKHLHTNESHALSRGPGLMFNATPEQSRVR